MKTFKLVGMVLMAVLMCVNFASCSKLDEPTQDNYITVGLNCVGEYLDIKDSPLSRSGELGNDTYYIQVLSLKEDGSTTPYADGAFKNSLEGLTVKLLQGEKYKFKAAIVVDKGIGYSTEFNYSPKETFFSFIQSEFITYEAFYGELNNYTPEEGGNVEIETKRVSYAANFIAKNLTEGTLNIEVSNPNIYGNQKRYSVSLTPEAPISDKIYSFWDFYKAWKGNITTIGNDPETNEPIYEYTNYTSEKTLNIKWAKEDGTVVPFGNYNVIFTRNVRTTIRIDVANLPSVNNGITITREDTAISDDENEFVIEGGEITEVPVTTE